jgi:hypothetical protein
MSSFPLETADKVYLVVSSFSPGDSRHSLAHCVCLFPPQGGDIIRLTVFLFLSGGSLAHVGSVPLAVRVGTLGD